MSSDAASTATVRALVAALRSLAPAADDADRIDRVRLFEELKSVAAAAQAVETRDFDRSQRAAAAVAGVAPAQQGRGVAGQIGLARRCSPWAAQRWLGWCRVLPQEMPLTFAALRAGLITEWRATLVARETLFLSRNDRMQVDAELAPHLSTWGDRQVAAEAKRAAYRLDPQGSLERIRGAERDRCVTLRPAPDAMARLSAFVPVAQGVAAYAALRKAADAPPVEGDDRGRGQIMADTLIERLTGQAKADAVPVEVEVLLTDHALFGRAGEPGADEPGELLGGGPIPAGFARELALGLPAEAGDNPRTERSNAPDAGARRSLRRLYTHPVTGQLMSMDSVARIFPANQRRFIRYRDQDTCRTPWCDAALRHIDHVEPVASGGRTSTANAAGLCEACNYAKQAIGWRAAARPDGMVELITPTGHRYRSRPPDPPGGGRPGGPEMAVIVDVVHFHGRPAA